LAGEVVEFDQRAIKWRNDIDDEIELGLTNLSFFRIMTSSNLETGAFFAFDPRKDVNYAKLDT
jgi:hypothetical protein